MPHTFQWWKSTNENLLQTNFFSCKSSQQQKKNNTLKINFFMTSLSSYSRNKMKCILTNCSFEKCLRKTSSHGEWKISNMLKCEKIFQIKRTFHLSFFFFEHTYSHMSVVGGNKIKKIARRIMQILTKFCCMSSTQDFFPFHCSFDVCKCGVQVKIIGWQFKSTDFETRRRRKIQSFSFVIGC